MVWQEIFDNQLKVRPDTVVHVWKGAAWLQELGAVTRAGLRAVLSSPWYLNHISYGIDWPGFYSIDPLAFNGTAQQEALVMGGEACAWAEYIDATNVVARMFPRAAAVRAHANTTLRCVLTCPRRWRSACGPSPQSRTWISLGRVYTPTPAG